jgi:histidinol-phosphatase (PHP family)
MLCDCHLHTSFSADSDTPVSAQIEQAIALGIKTICFTDHHDYDSPGPDGKDHFLLDFDSYFPAMQKYRERYRDRIEILSGVELGLQKHTGSYLNELTEKYKDSLDFVIGSNHFVDRIDVYSPSYYEMSPLSSTGDPSRIESERFEHFFRVSLSRLEKLSCFDSLGHMDFVIRYSMHKNKYYSYEAFRDYIDPMLEILIQKDKALEVNTAGFRYGLKNPNPEVKVLKRYKELGGKLITIGSDAHEPEDLGSCFAETVALLKECGFREYAVYKNRKPVLYPIG